MWSNTLPPPVLALVAPRLHADGSNPGAVRTTQQVLLPPLHLIAAEIGCKEGPWVVKFPWFPLGRFGLLGRFGKKIFEHQFPIRFQSAYERRRRRVIALAIPCGLFLLCCAAEISSEYELTSRRCRDCGRVIYVCRYENGNSVICSTCRERYYGPDKRNSLFYEQFQREIISGTC